jgi:hypothetical protein
MSAVIETSLRSGIKTSIERLTATYVAIVPSPPGAYLVTINPTKHVIAMKTAIGHPQRSISKLFRRYMPNHNGDSENDNATSARQYEPSHGIDTVSYEQGGGT